MADNLPVTPGVGATVAANDVGGVLHQRVKLSLGAAGSAVDATGGAGDTGDDVLRVVHATDDPLVTYFNSLNTSDPVPIESHGFDVTVVPTVTAGAYGVGDIMGGLLTFTVSSANDKPVIVTGISVAFKVAVMPNPLTLVLFSADPTTTTKTDNDPYSLNAADVFKVIDAVNFQSRGAVHFDHGTPNTISIDNLNIACKPATGTQNIFGLLIDGTGVTLTSTSDVQIRVRGVGV